MTKKKRWYQLDRNPEDIMRLLQSEAKMSIIKKLVSFKNSETFGVIVKIVRLLWRLFKLFKNNGSNQTRTTNL